MNQIPSIKKNYFYNTAFTIASFLFPLITFPYVARVLGPVYIGKVAFAESIVAYFALFASLGIPLYGIREVAKVRDDKEALNRIFSELFIINLSAMGISVLLFLSLFFLIEKIQAEEVLFLVLGINIVLGAFSIEWLYKGLENYQYITLRSLSFKVISLGLLFLLVRSQDNYVLFAGISVLALSGANILNMIHSRKYVKITLKKIHLRKHIKPIIILFSTSIAISIYINLDKVMLGFLADDKSVGLYTAAIKMNKITLAVVTSLAVVLIPRLSYYIEMNKKDEFLRLANKSLDFVFFLGIPSIIGILLLADNLVLMFSGERFMEAAYTVRILAPIILFIGLSNFFAFQIHLPENREKYNLYSVIVGASTNFFLNLILIPHFKHNGAAIATLIAEFSVAFMTYLFSKYKHDFKIVTLNRVKYFAISLFFVPIIFFVNYVVSLAMLSTSVSIVTCIIFYFTTLYLVNDKFFKELLSNVLKLT